MSLHRWWRGRRAPHDRYRPAGAAGSLAAGLEVWGRRWPDVRSPSTARPVFLLAAGWRSGSTFLQRRVLASRDALVWGEPWGHAAAIDQLAYPLRCLTEAWPHEDWFALPDETDALAATWTANLYPPAAALLAAHLAWFEALFAAPARAAGFARWGLKDVRLDGDHGRYLRWLFPHARFVLLYRNPYDAWRSYRRWRTWYLRWPDAAVTEPGAFGAHWRALVESFLAAATALDALVVRYEDLVTGAVAPAAVATHLAISAPAPEPLARIDSARATRPALAAVPAAEVAALRAAVDPVAARLGYEGPSVRTSD